MYTMFQYYTDSARIDQDRTEKMQKARMEHELRTSRAPRNKTSTFAARIFGLITTGPEPAATTSVTTAI